MKNRISPASSGASQNNRGRLVAIIAVAAMVLAGSLGGSHLFKRPGGQPRAETRIVPATTTDPSRGDFYYFRSGQWLADLRTLVAACRYVLEPESA